MRFVRNITLLFFMFLLVGSVYAQLQTNLQDPGLTQEDWRYHQDTSCSSNPNGVWTLIGVKVEGTPCSGEVLNMDWKDAPNNRKEVTLTIDNENNVDTCLSERNYFGIQAYPQGYKEVLYIEELEKFVVRAKIRNNEATDACTTSECDLCPPDYAGHTGGWVAHFIGIPMYDETNQKNLWMELVVYNTPGADYDGDQYLLFYGNNPQEELYRILVTHPLVNEPLIQEGEEYYYEIDVLPIIRGVDWPGKTYDWSKVHLVDAYIGSEIWSDAVGSLTVSEFDVLYEEKPPAPALDNYNPKGYHDPAPNECQVAGWTCDQDDYSQPLTVRFYDGSTLVGETTANQNRESAVGSQCGGYNNRGFTYTFPESVLHDGQQHTITSKAVGINEEGVETSEYSLTQTPRTVTCPLSEYEADFGILYGLWHCPDYQDPYDISKILSGKQSWGPIPEFHYWDEPKLGYYCLTNNEEVLETHASMLRDAGIDFVVLDISNNAYTDSRSDRSQTRIMEPYEKMLQVWSNVNGAPKIVPWIPLTSDSNMVDFVMEKTNNDPDMHYNFQGKPLILVVDNNIFPYDNNRINNLESQGYSVRRMWGLGNNEERWSFMELCSSGFKDSGGTQDCNQAISTIDGLQEQISVASAYQETYMSDKRTAVPKFQGRTFRKQFETVFENPSVPIVLISGWNEWMAQRFCLINGQTSDTNCNEQNDHFPDGTKVFVDAYDIEYNRDIEPGNNEMRDYYYQLMKSCISIYNNREDCSSNSQELCCKDYDAQEYNNEFPISDLNKDNVVNYNDLNLVLSVFNTYNAKYDVNYDDRINLQDIVVVAKNLV